MASGSGSSPSRPTTVLPVTPAPDGEMKPVLFEIFGEMWKVQARLGQGGSASVYRVSSGRANSAAVKEFQADPQGGDYGFLKERTVLEDIQGHKNIVTLYGVFTHHNPQGIATRCLLLELLDLSVSELLVRATNQGHSMWLIQHCARDILEALCFLHREGYVHADLKPRNILWSPDDECFKLIDFGLSFKEGHQDVKYIQTDGYRAPEAELQNSLAQAGLEGDSGCTTAVDLWSLGIILLEMFSGIKLKETVKSQEWKEDIFEGHQIMVLEWLTQSSDLNPMENLGRVLKINVHARKPLDENQDELEQFAMKEWVPQREDNSAAIVDHIFSSNSVVYPAIPVYHLRDLIKSMLHNNPSRRSRAEAALSSPFFSIPFAPHIEDLVLLPTPVLRLLNVIDDCHLHNDDEYEEIIEDMREECQKYGSVISLLIPKENPGKGQVFVEYANAGDSKEAQRLLTGRTFDGKFVVATFYPLSAYKRGYLYQTVQ